MQRRRCVWTGANAAAATPERVEWCESRGDDANWGAMPAIVDRAG